MIDIHHHLLYGLDDGSPDLETSIAMGEEAAADGITHIVCTPHANHRYTFDPAQNDEKLQILQSHLKGKVTLGLGCDFHISYDNVHDAILNPAKYTINHRQYLLVEFPDYGISPNMPDTFFQLGMAQLVPIITHPERNPTIKQKPAMLAEWLRGGCLGQVTAGSLLGRFGKSSQAFTRMAIEKNWAHFIATDAHNLTSRTPKMRQAYDVIRNDFGEETAQRLCVDNPMAAFQGDTFPHQPEPLDIYEDLRPKPKGFFASLFSR